MKNITIGLVGPIASGKGYLADYLRERGFSYYSLSDRVREEVERLGLPKKREILQDVGNGLRCQYGPCVLAERTIAKLSGNEGLVILDAIRNPAEIEVIRKMMDASIIAIDAPVELRLQWYLARAARRGEDGASVADFMRANARDLGIGENALGQQGEACMRIADHRIVNDGTRRMIDEARKIIRKEFEFDIEGRVVGIERK